MLVEAAAARRSDRRARGGVEHCAGSPTSAVATDAAAARALWRYREGHTEAINLLGAPHKLDVSLPAEFIAAFVRDVDAAIAAVAPDARGVAVRPRG